MKTILARRTEPSVCPQRLRRGRFAGLLVMLAGFWPLAPAATQATETVSAAFENRLYVPQASPTWGGSFTQSVAVTFFSGGIGSVGSPGTPTDGALFLVQSAFGQPVAPTMPPTIIFHCGEASPYHEWLFRYFQEGQLYNADLAMTLWGVKADPDGDGQDNLMEYAIGTDPQDGFRVSALRVQGTNYLGTNYLLAVFRERMTDPNLVFASAVSEDLVNWTNGAGRFVLLSSTPLSGEVAELTYLDTVPFTGANARFYKLQASYMLETPPTAWFLSLTNGSTLIVSNSTSLALGVTAPGGCVMLADYWVNGLYLGRSGGELSLDWLPLYTNIYQLIARVVDNYGMSHSVQVGTVYVDNDTDGDRIADRLDRRPTIPNEAPALLPFALSSAANFHTAGELTATASATDPDGDPVSYQLLMDANVLRNWQPLPILVAQPGPADYGLRLFAVRARDEWGAASEQSRQLYLFRTPPRP